MPARLIVFLLVLSLLCACSRGEKPAQPQAAAQDTTTLLRPTAQDNAAPTAEDTAVVHKEYSYDDPEKQIRERYLSRFTEEDWEKSVKDIKHLPPSDFALLPTEIQEWLAAEGYSIPQPYDATERVNVISGDFCAAGSQDWAVLASKDEICCIIVFRHGSASDTLIASVSPERDYMDYTGNGRFGFIRQIETADPFYGEKYTPANIDSIFPSTDHFGIGGKAHGGLLYCDNGIWYSFKGYYDEMYVSPGVWLAAAEALKRLPPSAFPDLPEGIRIWMEKEGYTVPQVYGDDEPHNVISGQFYQTGVTDWALLASKDLKSRLFIFRGGTELDSSLAGPCKETGYMQGFGDGILGFSWYISTADSAYILSQFKSYDRDEEPPFPIEHDGIEDGFMDKASTVLYHREGEWHELPGAD
ncbi:hypothetical protein LLH00_15545 [bacterium]|nr:hypothetical protein [bacterium]